MFTVVGQNTHLTSGLEIRPAIPKRPARLRTARNAVSVWQGRQRPQGRRDKMHAAVIATQLANQAAVRRTSSGGSSVVEIQHPPLPTAPASRSSIPVPPAVGWETGLRSQGPDNSAWHSNAPSTRRSHGVGGSRRIAVSFNRSMSRYRRVPQRVPARCRSRAATG